MNDLRTAAQQALEAWDNGDIECFKRSYTVMETLRAALAQQAEPTMKVGGHYHWKHDRSPPLVYVGKKGSWHQFERVDARGAVWCEVLGTDLHMVKETEQQAEPVAGKVVAWGIFTLTDGEWELQHPVFVGDEFGKRNAEFERASYSGPQPLEVRPLGVVTATAQQAEPVEPVAWATKSVHDKAYSEVELAAAYQKGWSDAMLRRRLGPHIIKEGT